MSTGPYPLAIKEVCTRAGMPLEEDKEEGPATTISFLGSWTP